MRNALTVVLTAAALAGCGKDAAGPGRIQSVVVTAPFTSVQAGQALQLTATATDMSGSVVVNPSMSWRSSAESVAIVSETGLVSALSAGSATITARAEGTEGSLDLTITPGTGGSATVTMTPNTFLPFTTTISIGGTVRFEFPSMPHNVIFDDVRGAPVDILPTSGRVVTRTFQAAGTFPYDCTLHPGMSGEVVVR